MKISDDLAHGQAVIVAFRWIMVTAGFVFALWNPAPVPALRLQILVILAIAVANFYLHTQLLRGRFALEPVVLAASAADVALITVLVLSGGRFDSPLYIYYYPAILVYSVAFPPKLTAVFTLATMATYAAASLDGVTDDASLRTFALRLLILVAVGVCGALYWKIERDRRARGDAERALTVASAAAEDLFFGQVVIIIARWTLIAACVGLVLWTAADEWQLITAIVPVVALMALNFFLHGRYLLERPANRVMTAAAALLDLAVITLVVWKWPGVQGLESQFFVLYYPVLMAFAFVFTPAWSVVYTGLTLLAYACVCLGVDPSLVADGPTLELLVQRLTTLAAVGGLSTYYWRVQRARRHAVLG
jgi:hypothetical protein